MNSLNNLTLVNQGFRLNSFRAIFEFIIPCLDGYESSLDYLLFWYQSMSLVVFQKKKKSTVEEKRFNKHV